MRAHGDGGDGGRQVPAVHPGERGRQGLVDGHRQRCPRRGQDRRLGGGGRRAEHHQDQQPGQEDAEAGAAEDRGAEDGEHVADIVGVSQADTLGPDARERLGREDDDHVGDEQHQRGNDRRAAGGFVPVGGLLVDRDRGVPAPVDEQHQDQAGDERLEATDVERVEPGCGGMDRDSWVMTIAHAHQGYHGQDEQHDDLDAEQGALQPGRDLDAAVADVGHRDDPQHPDEQYPGAGRVRSDALGPEEQEHVLPRHLRQAGHDEDVGRDDAPPAGPARPRAERAGGPGERGAAVRVGLVQLAVADGGEQHRDEGQDRHDGRLQADGQNDKPEGGRQAVRRGGRRHAHHDAGHEPKSAGLEAFFDLLLGWPDGFLGRGHLVTPFLA